MRPYNGREKTFGMFPIDIGKSPKIKKPHMMRNMAYTADDLKL